MLISISEGEPTKGKRSMDWRNGPLIGQSDSWREMVNQGRRGSVERVAPRQARQVQSSRSFQKFPTSLHGTSYAAFESSIIHFIKTHHSILHIYIHIFAFLQPRLNQINLNPLNHHLKLAIHVTVHQQHSRPSFSSCLWLCLPLLRTQFRRAAGHCPPRLTGRGFIYLLPALPSRRVPTH